MSTAVTSNTIELPEALEGREQGFEAWKDVTQPASNGFRLRHSQPTTPAHNGVSSEETAWANTDGCTYETHEIKETEEAQEAEERQEAQETEESEENEETDEPTEPRKTNGLEKREKKDSIGPKLWGTIDEAISKCEVTDNRDINRPLFMLAHKVRSIEEELNVHFSTNLTVAVVRRWQARNHDHLEDDHDYVTEFLDKLSLVRYPKGRALARAVEIARGLVPPKKTAFLSPDVQLLASLCKVLQQQRGKKPFFLDGRSAATALGRPHETVASWLRGLHHLGVIRRESRGVRGMASLYSYLD